MRWIIVSAVFLGPLVACGSSVSDADPNDPPSIADDDDQSDPVCELSDCCPATAPAAGSSCDLADFASCDFGCDGAYECQPVYPEAGAPSEWVKVSDGGCCPESAPSHGASCEGDLVCPYEDNPLGSNCAASFEASCVDGAWESLKPASCEPATACDPSGAFTIVYGGWEPALDPAAPTTLTIALDEAGSVFSSAPEALVTDDGCTFAAEWHDEYCMDFDGEELCEYETFTAVIDFTGATPTGTMEFVCEGECGDMANAPIVLEAM